MMAVKAEADGALLAILVLFEELGKKGFKGRKELE
jgi:hypothetical protein